MLSNLKDFFNFNATERNGILTLLLLIIVTGLIPRVYVYYNKPSSVDFTAFRKEVDAFSKSCVSDSSVESSEFIDDRRVETASITSCDIKLFPFDPNTLSAEKWSQLGVKDWQIRMIQKYLSKGGRFQKKEDVKKIYGLTAKEYNRIEPYIVIPDHAIKPDSLKKTGNNKGIAPQYSRKSIIVDINTADTSTLQELKGIGPAFARRIVKYRDILGGYCMVSQLLEVYGFDQQRYDQISSYCLVGDGPYRKMNLNSVTLSELKKHPYLDYYIAKAIVDRRIAKGNYASVSQLKEIPLITDEVFEKIKPYLMVE
jgi:competence protein ComEA